MHNRYVNDKYRYRRLITIVFSLAILIFAILTNTPYQDDYLKENINSDKTVIQSDSMLALNVLQKLIIKGRSPKTNYSRDEFGSGWQNYNGCDTRNIILNRDLVDVVFDSECNVLSGVLFDPYTAKTINFLRGSKTSSEVQIDHVVALGDAWQKGAQILTKDKRIELANDPLELLAVDGDANMEKSDGDAATWLPPNKSFRCQYVSRQIAVKYKYNLWVTQAEYNSMKNVLDKCPMQLIPQ